MRLLFLRHGQTHANVSGALDTADPGLELTDLGQQQAVAAVPHLLDHAPVGVYVSSRLRAHQTAAPVAKELGVAPTQLAGLEEIWAGNWEMRTDQEAVDAYLTTVGTWLDGRLDAQMAGAETGEGFLSRYDAAVAQIAEAGHETALIVSHGAAIRTWTELRAEADQAHRAAWLSNTGLVTVEGDPDSGWRLVSWRSDPIGGVGH